MIYKLNIYLIGSNVIEGSLKLKVEGLEVVRETPKTLKIKLGLRVNTIKKSELNVIYTDRWNNTFELITFSTYCYEHDIEDMTKKLNERLLACFTNLEKLYISAKTALDGNKLNIIHKI